MRAWGVKANSRAKFQFFIYFIFTRLKRQQAVLDMSSNKNNCDGSDVFLWATLSVFVCVDELLWQDKSSFHYLRTWVAVSAFMWIKIVIIFYKKWRQPLDVTRHDICQFIEISLRFPWNSLPPLYQNSLLWFIARFYISLASSTRQQQQQRDNFPFSKALICSIDPIIIIQFAFTVCVCAVSVKRSLKIDVFMLS